MTGTIRFELNGAEVSLHGQEPLTPLLHVLRSRGLVAAKEGCAEGECGACAVVLREQGADGSVRFEAVQSCLLAIGSVHGGQCWTVEALGTPARPHPVQAALIEHGGSQCGYCTPGFVATLFAHYYRSSRPDPVHALSGNLCRCTGYRPIVDAARSLPVVAGDDVFCKLLARPSASQEPLHCTHGGVTFDRPTTLRAALEARARHTETVVLAGGTDLLVEWLDAPQPRHVLALDAVAELRTWRKSEHFIELGAGLTLADLEDTELAARPLWRELLPLFASRQIRTRATLGGNLMTASPVGDCAPVLLALDAELVLSSLHGQRTLPLADFFLGYRKTAILPDELLQAVRIPVPGPAHARFYKVQRRAADDIACVSLAAAVALDASGEVTHARLAWGGVAATPLRIRPAELALEGTRFEPDAVVAARDAALAALTPMSDPRGSAEFRRELVGGLLAKFRHEALP